jgi:hypothetical protein
VSIVSNFILDNFLVKNSLNQKYKFIIYINTNT